MLFVHGQGYLGDLTTLNVLSFTFNTTTAAGAPIALVGGAVSVYRAGVTAESTAGVTLTVDFDAVTGLNHVLITPASDLLFYLIANDYSVVLTAGTVDGQSVVGTTLVSFSIANRNLTVGGVDLTPVTDTLDAVTATLASLTQTLTLLSDSLLVGRRVYRSRGRVVFPVRTGLQKSS